MNILVTGMSGMLGQDICKIFASNDKFSVYGICRNFIVTTEKVKQYNIDITNKIDFSNVLLEVKPDVIIHTAALVDVDKCEEEKQFADNLHANFLDNIIVNTPNAFLIYISSDSVFDGETGNYNEISQVSPLNYYAFSKTKGEDKIIKEFKNSLIVRTNIFGFHNPPKPSLVEWALDKLGKEENIGGFYDVYFNPIYTLHLAEIIYKLYQQNIKGIINIGSEENISKYEFLILLANTFELNEYLIEKKTVKEFDFKAQRPHNTTLNLNLLKEKLGYLPSIKTDLLRFKNNYIDLFNKD